MAAVAVATVSVGRAAVTNDAGTTREHKSSCRVRTGRREAGQARSDGDRPAGRPAGGPLQPAINNETFAGELDGTDGRQRRRRRETGGERTDGVESSTDCRIYARRSITLLLHSVAAAIYTTPQHSFYRERRKRSVKTPNGHLSIGLSVGLSSRWSSDRSSPRLPTAWWTNFIIYALCKCMHAHVM